MSRSEPSVKTSTSRRMVGTPPGSPTMRRPRGLYRLRAARFLSASWYPLDELRPVFLVVLDVDEGEPDHAVERPLSIFVGRLAAELFLLHLLEQVDERGVGSSEIFHHALQRPILALGEGPGVELFQL